MRFPDVYGKDNDLGVVNDDWIKWPPPKETQREIFIIDLDEVHIARFDGHVWRCIADNSLCDKIATHWQPVVYPKEGK